MEYFTSYRLHAYYSKLCPCFAKLAEALSSGCCPTGLQLKLNYNQIGDAGGIKLAEALSSDRCPAGLKLDLRDNEIREAVLENINKLLAANEKRHIALACVTLRQGLRSAHSPLKRVPDVIAEHIFNFVLPTTSSAVSLFFKQQIKQAALPSRLVNASMSENKSESVGRKFDPS